MEYAEAIDTVKQFRPEGQCEDIGLYQMQPGMISEIALADINRRGVIDRDDMGAALQCDFSKATRPTANFEKPLVL